LTPARDRNFQKGEHGAMKIIFNRDDLIYATRTVSSIVQPQTALPILGNILIRAEGDTVIFRTSDLESSITCSINARVEVEGVITVPAVPFANMVREFPGEEISIAIEEDDKVVIRSERDFCQLQTMNPSEFPAWSDIASATTFNISEKDLRYMISKIIFAIPTKDPRKVLLGSLLCVDTDFPEYLDVSDVEAPVHLRMVATDGKKLSYVDCAGSGLQGKVPTKAIVHFKILSELLKMLGDEGAVTVGIGERQISFKFGKTEFKTNMIEGEFPNYEMVVPREFTINIPLQKSTFLNAVRRAAIVSDMRSNTIIFKFHPGEVMIEASSFDLGSFSGTLPLDYEGEPFALSLSHKYLQEVLHVIDAEEITLHIKNPSLPLIFHVKDTRNPLYLLMPIRVAQPSEQS